MKHYQFANRHGYFPQTLQTQELDVRVMWTVTAKCLEDMLISNILTFILKQVLVCFMLQLSLSEITRNAAVFDGEHEDKDALKMIKVILFSSLFKL